MTTTGIVHADATPLIRLARGVADGMTIVHRNLLQLRHSPGAIIGTLAFPLAFVVLFGYVFGSAIPVGDGANYREYLMPGLFVMGITTGLMSSLIAVATDNGGVVCAAARRFRAPVGAPVHPDALSRTALVPGRVKALSGRR
jgi:ABC-2 type transport system permease protein